MNTNHYYCTKVLNSNIILETRRANEHICGKVMHIMHRNGWRDAENVIYWRNHHSDNKESSKQIINAVGNNKNARNKRKL